MRLAAACRLIAGLALLLAASACAPTFTARKGELLLTIDHSATAQADAPEHSDASEGITELRWLGLYGAQAVFMKTEQGADTVLVPETQETVRIHPRDSTNIVLDTRTQREIEVRGYRIRIEDISPEEIGFEVQSPS